jgi:hypothetical protein
MSLQAMQALLAGSMGGSAGGSALDKELAAGFELDAKRQAEDSMKKRAILTAGSYDEFRHLVAAAGQTPLAPGDLARQVEVSRNRGLLAGAERDGRGPRAVGLGLAFPEELASAEEQEAARRGCVSAQAARLLERQRSLLQVGSASSSSSSSSSAEVGAGVAGSAAAASYGLPPRSCAEFDRVWRRLPTAEADAGLAYLLWLGPVRLGAAFRVDLDAAALGAVLCALAGGGEGSQDSLPLQDLQALQQVALEQRLELLLAVCAAAPQSALGLAAAQLSTQELAAAEAMAAAAEGLGRPGDARRLREAVEK